MQNSRVISDPAAVIHLLFRLSSEILRGFRINSPCRRDVRVSLHVLGSADN